jgi:serine/threonine protein phosphatase PrpC
MVLADGMGGHLHGEVAAQLAINTFMQAFMRSAQPNIAQPEAFLAETMQCAHDAIIKYAEDQRLGGNPGTTCVAALVQDDRVVWTHAGDSRLYLLRDGQVAAVTHDHSIVQQWADYGIIGQSETRTHAERNKITNCLGGVGRMFYVDPASALTLQESNDVLLLCSDGLWGPLSDEELVAGFNSKSLPDSMEALMDTALSHAGSGADNTTAVAVRWGDAEEEHAAPEAICNMLGVDEENSISELLGRTGASIHGGIP